MVGVRLSDGVEISGGVSSGDKGSSSSSSSMGDAWFGRVDFTVRALHSRTRTELWNLTYSEVPAL